MERSAFRVGLRGGLLIIAAVLLYVGLAGYEAAQGEPNADEGFYLAATRAVMDGAVPYRDFGYTQTPLLPYVQGLIFRFTGADIVAQRTLNIFLGAASLALVMTLCLRRGASRMVVFALAVVWCFTPLLLYFLSIGKTYAVVQLALIGAASAFFLPVRPLQRLLLLAVCCTIAVGARSLAAPVALLLWCGFAWEHRRELGWAALVGIPALTGLLLIGPFFVIAPANAWFWNWDYHVASRVPRLRLETLADFVVAAPAIVALAGMTVVLIRRRTESRPAVWIFAAAAAGVIFAVAGVGIYAEYAVPFLPLLLLGSGLLAMTGDRRWTKPVALLAAAAAVTTYGLRPPLEDYGYLKGLASTRTFLEAETQPGEAILTPMPEVAVEAGRPLVPGFELGNFSLTIEMSDELAAQRRIVTRAQLLTKISERQAPVIVLTRYRSWNFNRTIPSLGGYHDAFYREFAEVLLAHYQCVHRSAFFLVFRPRTEGASHYPLTADDLAKTSVIIPGSQRSQP